METFFSLLTFPIKFLNFGGGIIAGIWLIVNGKWTLVVSAIISTLIANWILGFLMMPTLLIIKPLASGRFRKKKFLVFILGILYNFWTYGLMFFYAIGSFYFVFNNFDGGSPIPYLLLAYSMATSPWTYMASQESRATEVGMGTLLPVLAICVASIAMMTEVFLFGNLSFLTLAITSAIPLILALIVQVFVFYLTATNIPEEIETSPT